MEPHELGERLRAHADDFVEHATKVALAHTEVVGNGTHVGAGQALRGGERELDALATGLCNRRRLGDSALEDCSRGSRVRSVGEPSAQSARRGVTPQLIEGNDACGERGGGHAEHRLRCAQLEARRHDPLPAADLLAMHSLSSAERVHVETTPRRRPEADDEVNLGTRDRHAGSVSVAVVREQGRYGGRR